LIRFVYKSKEKKVKHKTAEITWSGVESMVRKEVSILLERERKRNVEEVQRLD